MMTGHHGFSHPSGKMLPVERAHSTFSWGQQREITSNIRAVYKKRHRKKSRSHGKRLIAEQTEH